MFSQTVEYALRAVCFLAGQAPVARTTDQIATATRVPKAYLSKVLQEERESKTNNLLQVVTVLSGISSIAPAIDMINQAEKYLNWPPALFYGLVSITSLILATGVVYYIFPELFKKVWKGGKSNLE